MSYQQQRIQNIQEYKYTSETKTVRSNTPQTRETRYQIHETSIDNIRSTPESRQQKLSPQICQFLMACEIERLGSENEKLRFRIKEIQDNTQDRHHLEQQIIDLTNKLNEMINIVETHKIEKSELIIQITTLQEEIHEQKELQTNYYESRVVNLSNQIDNLTLQLREFETIKLDEMQVLRNQLESEMKTEIEKAIQTQELNSQYQREFLEGELKKWKDLCNQKQKENDELKNVILQKEINKQRELENQLQSYKNETERVNKLLVSKSEETENWKQKYLKLQLMNDDYKRIQQENQQLNDTILVLESQLKQRQEQQNQIKQQLENANNQFLSEKSKVNQLLTELQDIQKKKQEVEGRYQNLLLEVDKLNQIIKQKEQITITQTTKIEEFQSTFVQYRNTIEDKSQEIENLRRLLTKLQQQIIQLEDQVEQLKKFQENCRVLSAEIDRLNDEIKVQDDELRQWRMQYADEGSIIKKLQDQLQIIVVLASEVESLRMRLHDKEQEVEDVRRSSLAPYKI
ncbi:unnamed protein product [Paramecium pentaurelia]|uniref:Uncharacterized protein n=1 Tax=Paramecium pentaurelia TaxID=43138 RepID=A0A8S1X3K6_9CILI|nr:unnamed protein product [Paramecium pentaurelia]